VTPASTRTRILLLQHVLEVPKVSNTGRLAALGLSSLVLHLYPQDPLPEALAEPGTWLLFPGGQAALPVPPPAQLVVLDASWSQARRMAQRVAALRALPRWSLALDDAAPSLRRGPPGGLSTLQALAHALGALEGPSVAMPLHALHRRLVDRTLAARGYL
jgi:DTW domain-containing protein YfiP